MRRFTILNKRKSAHRVQMLLLDKIKLDKRIYIPEQAAKAIPKDCSLFDVEGISVYALNAKNAIRKHNNYLDKFGHQFTANITL